MQTSRATRLLVVAAAIEFATGVSLYAFPRDFPPAMYAPLIPYIPQLSAALLCGGLFLLLVVRYQLPVLLRHALALLATLPLLILARYILSTGGFTGATAYLLLATGMAVAPWVERARGERALDLFPLTLGAIHLVIGTLWTFLPEIFFSPAFQPIRPLLQGLGPLSLAVGLLMILPLQGRLPRWARRMLGAGLPLVLTYTFSVTGTWTGVILWVLWAAGALLDSNRFFRPMGPGAENGLLAEQEEEWVYRTLPAIETGTWLLTLLVVVLTALLGPSATESMPRAFLFVLLLSAYNVTVYWVLPPIGTPRTRIYLHLFVLAASIGILLSGAGSVAGALLPLLLAIPMVAARTGGLRWGYATLAFVLLVLTLSTLADLWLDQHPAGQVAVTFAVQLFTLAATGATGVMAAADQRRTFRQLRSTTGDLTRRHAELEAAYQLLAAQGEELAAQQDELINQHEKLQEQSTILRAQRDELEESESRFRTSFQNAPNGMALFSLDRVILQANRAMAEMLGYTQAELVGRTAESISHPEDYPERVAPLEDLLAGRRDGYQLEKRFLHRDGHPIWVNLHVAVIRDSLNHPLYLIAQMIDITERRRAEEQLRRLANYDPLTDLLNRPRFEADMERHLQDAARSGASGALLFLDFDQFKYVNDSLGHRAGDELLKGLARVLERAVGMLGPVARLGGDEFAIYLPGADVEQAETVATRLLETVRKHIDVVGGQQVGMTVSIGIALHPEHGRTVEELMLHGDLAMYQAKAGGRNRYRVYALDQIEEEMGSKLNWERRIREALADDRFVLHYQPILDLATNSVTAYEALLRLREADGALISPGQFLGVAESYGLIHAIDRWVVSQAIRTIAEQRRNRRRIGLAVNLSARAFADVELLPLIREELIWHDVDPAALTFEITETAAVADIQTARKFIETLTEMGCRFALDDFGAGLSSLYYLKSLPVSCLKIDGSFIERLPEEPVDQKMVRAVVTLARELGIRTVAEYVSSDETLVLLRSLGVDAVQGYHIGVPGPLPQ